MNAECISCLDLLALALHDSRAPETAPAEFTDHPELCALYDELFQLRCFIRDIAAGDLATSLPLKGYAAGVLKSLQANLKHMTWQTQMIASGDFSQKLDFMGDFSKAFNSMTAQLERSVAIIREKERELERINAGLLKEIAGRKQVQAALVQREAHYRNLTETMKDVVWILDADQLAFTYVSPSVLELRGYTAEEVLAAPLQHAFTAESLAVVTAGIEHFRTAAGGQYQTYETEQPCRHGGTVWTETIIRFVCRETGHELHGVSRDISDRRALRLELQRQATTDELTGIANRRSFMSHADQEIRRSRRHKTPLSFLMLDIDYFKRVNDTFGHAVGDEALKAVARTCVAIIRSSDRVGRLGGEEFGALLIETRPGAALIAAERLRVAVAALEVHAPDGKPVPLRVSIGIASFDPDSDELSVLMRKADQALYQAKQTGRDRVVSHG